MLLSIVLAAFFSASVPQNAGVDVTYWDSVLACYERLCDACVENKDSMSIAAIKSELDQLLREPVGKMNEDQQKRFEHIRQRYNGIDAGSIEKGHIDTIVIVKQIPVKKIREIDHVVVYDTVKVQNNINTIVVEHQYSRKDTTVIVHTIRPETVGDNVMKAKQGKNPITWFVGATVGFVPDFSAGLMAGVGRNAGLYVKGRSNFKSIRPEYSVDTGESSFWGNGVSDVTRHVACLGGWFTIIKGLKIYAGAGYGQSCYYMQNTSGEWVEISNCSYRNFAADLGLMYRLGRVSFFGGANTTGFKYFDVEAGIAINFGR